MIVHLKSLQLLVGILAVNDEKSLGYDDSLMAGGFEIEKLDTILKDRRSLIGILEKMILGALGLFKGDIEVFDDEGGASVQNSKEVFPELQQQGILEFERVAATKRYGSLLKLPDQVLSDLEREKRDYAIRRIMKNGSFASTSEFGDRSLTDFHLKKRRDILSKKALVRL
ncbi:hypothetical protein V6N13_138439 [Hibiscus sabdariffa]|uniref:Uncharacterized protein n=1 Tax=Hibiscus sabdariffa TaxID=183260 RepID=A0ABR2QDF1_9ROSI